jgi:hypothetical protein
MDETGWTLEQAIAEQQETGPGQRDIFDPTGPIYRWDALQKLEALERNFAKGDNFALLHAIRICANHDLVIPEWAARAYIKRFDAVLNCETDSWDGAFGRPYPNGVHLSKARQRRKLRFAVYARVRELLKANPKRPIDEGLFEEVGDKFDIGKTLCGRLYYEAKRMVGLPPKS